MFKLRNVFISGCKDLGIQKLRVWGVESVFDPYVEINIKSVLESVGLTAPVSGEQYWRIPQDIGARALKVQLDTIPYLLLNVMITGGFC